MVTQEQVVNQPIRCVGLVKLIRRLPEYEAWKRAVFIRDRFQCQQCGRRNGRKRVIEAHHLQSFSSLVKVNGITSVEGARECFKLWEVSNGLCLCHSCHQLTESYPKQFVKPVKKKRHAIRKISNRPTEATNR